MTDFIFQMGLSNASFSVALAIVAMLVGRFTARPHLSYMLWLLVFIKLVTPPLLELPVICIPGRPVSAQATENELLPSMASIDEGGRAAIELPSPRDSDSAASQSAASAADGHASSILSAEAAIPAGRDAQMSRTGTPPVGQMAMGAGGPPRVSLWATAGRVFFDVGKRWLLPAWLLGSTAVLIWSLVRVYRFGRLLAAQSQVAPAELQAAAARIADRLKLRGKPMICTTPVRISPLVWWAGGNVRIVIPESLLKQMKGHQWQWVLAHELAHVRRRDYIVRWLEWLACVGFWWNPVVWRAQRQLRAAEEICCDALVLSSLKPKPRTYANALLQAVEFLARPALRPPAIASEINSGGVLERRFRMIVSGNSNQTSSRWLRAGMLLCAVVVLPFGLASAQDHEAIGRRLREAVEAGELTGPQARTMMKALGDATQADDDAQQPEGAASERIVGWLKSVGERLKRAVKSGDLSEEEAWAKWLEIKQGQVAPKLKAAVKSGDLPESEAWDIWRGIEKAEAGVRLRAAVKRGKMSKEEAWAKWLALQQDDEDEDEDLDDDREHDGGEWIEPWLKSLGEPIRKAFESGELSEEDAWAKWQEIKEHRIAPKLKGAVKTGDLSEAKAWAVWHGIEKAEAGARLKLAVAAGKMSKEEAWAKWAEINRDDDEEDDEDEDEEEDEEEEGEGLRAIGEHLRDIGDRIRAAVASGKISEEEGWKKWLSAKEKTVNGAVTSGKISREEAKVLRRAIKKAETGMILKKAVADGELSEKEAREKWEAFERNAEK